MLKRKNQKSVYQITGEHGAYIVVIEHLRNTACGCPRFSAVIIKLEENQEGKLKFTDGDSLYNAVYNFTGHYLSERSEAEWILSRFEKEVY